MRSTGVVDSARDLGHHDHLCWGYEHHRDFRDEAMVFVDEGLGLGHRVLYTGEGDHDSLRSELDGIANLDHLIDNGTIELLPILATYGTIRAGHDQAEAYSDATRRAVDAGHSGLRVVADATALVVHPVERDAFVRYEHRIDRLMAAGLPFSAMCGYDRRRLGQVAVEEIGSVHPLVDSHGSPYQLHAHDGGDTLRLAGEIDAWHELNVEHSFARTAAAATHDPVVVDCADLGFVHHRGLQAMDRAARATGAHLELVDPPSTVAPVVELLRLGSITVSHR